MAQTGQHRLIALDSWSGAAISSTLEVIVAALLVGIGAVLLIASWIRHHRAQRRG
jgi:hypothetical protein